MKSKKQKRVKITCYILLIVISITMLFPFFWMVRSAFMTNREITTVPIKWIPSRFSFDNFKEAFTKDSFGRYFLNSAVIVVVNMVGSIFKLQFYRIWFFKAEIQGPQYLVRAAFVHHDDTIHGPYDPAVSDMAVCGRVQHVPSSYGSLFFRNSV